MAADEDRGGGDGEGGREVGGERGVAGEEDLLRWGEGGVGGVEDWGGEVGG